MISLVLFSFPWIFLSYFFNCLLAKKFLVPDIQKLLLYIFTVTLIAIFGEIFWDSLYTMVFGYPLWEYHILPIHNAYTSYYSLFFIWPLCGFHLYFFHEVMKSKLHQTLPLSIIFGIEALIVETLFNVASLQVFGKYIAFYLPADLWHFTSLQVFPIYLLGGAAIMISLKKFSQSPKFFILMSIMLLITVVFFTN